MGKVIFIALLLCNMMGARAQKITVKGDRELNVNFSKYKTFYWASQVDQKLDPGAYFLNDLLLKADIRDAVKHEMEGLGYRPEPMEPDLIVNFRVFDKPVRIKGYEGYGTTYWGEQEVRVPSDTTSYALEAGTLLISLVDRQKGNIVWQGFASGMINNDEFIKDEGKIKEAVNLIFKEYGMRATNQ